MSLQEQAVAAAVSQQQQSRGPHVPSMAGNGRGGPFLSAGGAPVGAAPRAADNHGYPAAYGRPQAAPNANNVTSGTVSSHSAVDVQHAEQQQAGARPPAAAAPSGGFSGNSGVVMPMLRRPGQIMPPVRGPDGMALEFPRAATAKPIHPSQQAKPPVASGGIYRPMIHSNPPAVAQPPRPERGGMSELRVEDALMYLDDVKREFGHQPKIYNEFLEIMKNFKSQAVDTPGVIDRVSRLFRGYNNLILGFNKFLPEGYKISLQDLERREAELVRQAAAQQQQQQQQASQQQQQQQAAAAARQQQAHQAQQTQQTQQQQVGSFHQGKGQQATNVGTAAAQATVPQAQSQSGDKPGDSAPIGVISTQFGGQKQPLILRHAGSPPILLPLAEDVARMNQAKKEPAEKPTQESVEQAPRQPLILRHAGSPPYLAPLLHSPGRVEVKKESTKKSTQESVEQAPQQQQQQQQQQQPHQAVEFDHAISYVTNIKKRFADDPSAYHQFLEILHTYQKEQRGIKEVLEQVAALFADHPDLLKEFTFFLPDAVQEQAKERLHRAAADSEARHAMAAQQKALEQQGGFGKGPSSGWQRGNNTSTTTGKKSGSASANNNNSSSGTGTTTSSSKKKSNKDKDSSNNKDKNDANSQDNRQKFIDMTAANQTANVEMAEPAPTPRQPSSSGNRKRPFTTPNEPREPAVPTGSPPPAETFVYNSAVERQFFEATKEALCSYSRDGGQAWAEFIKCLDMYAQDVLSKSEMLAFVEPLLGKRNVELFEEFKRILAAAGSPTGPTPSVEDSWYSVPLSEIDFSRCRQCTPSDRALPRDYPAPPCSDRSDEDRKVLNDVWVSLPKGSEESYTFRHMRRNHYEEVLFRVEDERFEIDMVLDSNAATMRRLEPIVEEISKLSKDESLVSKQSASSNRKGSTGAMGGMRYQYTFDPAILDTIQRNSIVRLYGDAGKEMLDLMVKNPTVAIPLVLRRLRQKDGEWRAVRDKLNRQWRELAEVNYFRSLDHRSLTWRTIDKRGTSTRTLASEIKDRAANEGREGEASLAARLEKAKEEHGSFYEVTKAHTLSKTLDLSKLPKPYAGIFTPHMSLMYNNNSWAQRDAYRILTFALERGNTSPGDKERCHRIWKEFFGPLFGIESTWMERPAFAYQTAMEMEEEEEEDGAETEPATVGNVEDSPQDDEEDSADEQDADMGDNVVTEELRDRGEEKAHSKTLFDHQALPSGVTVSTLYGNAKIVQFRPSDGSYEVEYPFGTGFIRPDVILSSVIPVEESAYTKQTMAADTSTLQSEDDKLCLGTQSLYLFFRLHQILVRRLNIAKEMAYKVTKDQSLRMLVEQMASKPGEDVGKKRYEAYLSLVYALVDGGGSTEGGKYEDRVRCLLGHGAYELATMDKLLSHILKNLQNIGTDEVMHNLIQLYRRHDQIKPESFRQEAAYLSEGENMFAFQLCKVPGTDNRVLYIEYMGVIYESEDEDESLGPSAEGPPSKRSRTTVK